MKVKSPITIKRREPKRGLMAVNELLVREGRKVLRAGARHRGRHHRGPGIVHRIWTDLREAAVAAAQVFSG